MIFGISFSNVKGGSKHALQSLQHCCVPMPLKHFIGLQSNKGTRQGDIFSPHAFVPAAQS